MIRRTLERHALKPAAEADRATLLRRAKFDLLGLPPTLEELDDFLSDPALDAYSKLIDRLLASPQYGERWGRHWLDVVRFGESDGFENDRLREHAWRYRDYVIESLNRDKPYDQFAKEQLAGDVLEPVTEDGIVATGFLVAGPWDEIQFVAKSPTERRRAREEQQEELLATISQTFLGLTVHCARCHDHKFDPIKQTDYYALKAVFDGVDHRTGDPQIDNANRGNRSVFTPDEQAAFNARRAPALARIGQLKLELDALHNRLGSDARAMPDNTHDAGTLLSGGKFGQGLNGRFGHAEANAKPAYHTPPLTVECWANVVSAAGFNILVASHPKESSEHWEVYTYAGSGEFSVYLPGYEPAEIKSGVSVTDASWHYLAMTFDGDNVQLLVDGRLVRTAAVRRVRTAPVPGPLWLGAYPPQKIKCDGVVDEVRLSKGVRSIDGAPIDRFAVDESTIGLWHCDALDGERFIDASQPVDDGARESVRNEIDAVRARIEASERELAAEPTPLTYAGVRREPDPTVVFLRGDIQKPGPAVAPASPGAVRAAQALEMPTDTPEGQRRARFADWVASPSNPLFARVMANRIWQYHFGTSFVDTPSDFGWNGGQPSHPDLLDWLASEFVECGFSMKHMHRLIMNSATYRQSSAFDREAARVDADNRLVWRFGPRRLEAETVRDAMLAVSGEWNPQIGGPSFRPFTTTALLTQFYHLVDDGRPDFNRRTIYRINVNTAKDPFLDSLDCPSPSVTAPKRRSTTTTLQALALMNDSFVVRQADRFATRLRTLAGDDVPGQVRMAVRLAFGRDADSGEVASLVQFVSRNNLESLCWSLLNTSEFLHVR
jgi:hypothetical protein